MKSTLKRIARRLLGDYSLYEVWKLRESVTAGTSTNEFTVREITRRELEDPRNEQGLRESAWYFGDQSVGFGCFEGDRLLAIAFFWYGKRYAQRLSWPIEPSSAKLVHIETADGQRGRGVATMLIRAASAAMLARGHEALYARIWHSNVPSRAAFSRAGWQRAGWLLQVNPLRRAHPWSLRLHTPRR